MATKRKRDVPTLGLTGEGGLPSFKKAVQELKNKSQSKIAELTKFAETQYDCSYEVVQILVEEVSGAPLARLQPLISVVDSILKKVGKDYRNHFSERVPDMIRTCQLKSDETVLVWIRRTVKESWRRHELLPAACLDKLEAILAAPAGKLPVEVSLQPPTAAAGVAPADVQRAAQGQPGGLAFSSMPTLPQSAGPPGIPPLRAKQPPLKAPPPAQPAYGAVAPGVAPGAEAAVSFGVSPGMAPFAGLPGLAPSAGSPPVKAPPGTASPTQDAEQSAQKAKAKAAPVLSPEQVERRLAILTKIIEKGNPANEELQEIMKVPEIRKAIAMQQRGQRQEAMALLSRFKHDLEKQHAEYSKSLARDPRRPDVAGLERAADPRRADPRRVDQTPSDPRQQEMRQSEKPSDPRQAVQPELRQDRDSREPMQHVDPRHAALGTEAGSVKRAAEESEALRQKQQRLDLSEPMGIASSMLQEPGSDDEKDMLDPSVSRPHLQGLPSIGFSEAWLRQFMEQMPTRTAPSEQRKSDAPQASRKVLGARGDQMVYVDELSPNEVLLLMQLIFLLEDRLRRTGAAMDLAQRIPHTFSYLQVEPAIDVMLKRFFDELPFQCTTTGLRFASREKLRKHHDALYRRRTLLQQRQRGTEARGWMETIPDWVGNRDLAVGPALFRLGGAGDDAPKAAELQRSVQDAAAASDSDEEGRWICPVDERRSVCPISGEPFETTWSSALNDWAFTDVVAVELGSSKPLRFPQKVDASIGFTQRLSETAAIYKKSCFLNTSATARQQALEECRSFSCSLGAPTHSQEGSRKAPEDEELAALARDRIVSSKFF